ncbi:hypothetical protein DFH11DRAFT_1727106 [Phellopilus nigrolimitatus]|nr:hypothetical protein DFH11DRAFT_1727106 [Phellopilus nigrolimitatus]
MCCASVHETDTSRNSRTHLATLLDGLRGLSTECVIEQPAQRGGQNVVIEFRDKKTTAKNSIENLKAHGIRHEVFHAALEHRDDLRAALELAAPHAQALLARALRERTVDADAGTSEEDEAEEDEDDEAKDAEASVSESGWMSGEVGFTLPAVSTSRGRFWAYDESKKIVGVGPNSPARKLALAGSMGALQAGGIAGFVGNPGDYNGSR